MQIEKASFTPIIFSTTGGMSTETMKYHKRIAALIAEKRNEEYTDVINYVRTRLRFCLLKSTIISLRGVRGKQQRNWADPVSSLSFNLIDSGK